MSRAVVAVLGLIILAASGVLVFQTALEDAGEDVTIQNESWTPTAGQVTTLSDSNLDNTYYNHEVDVYDDMGNEMEAGTDYRWFIRNGTVKALSGGGLDGDSSATITYGYQQTTQEQRDLTALVSLIPTVLGLLAPVAVVVIAAALLGG